MKTFAAFLTLVALATAFDFPDEWNDWKEQFGRDYPDNSTEFIRYTIWQDNKDHIDDHNENLAESLGYTLGLNEYSDLNFTESVELLTGATVPSNPEPAPENFTSTSDSLPPSVDWRTQGYVTGVKNQGSCGSCWAFSATGALEGQHFKATGNLVSLSEQNLVDCDTSNQGCHGGWPYLAYQYVINNGGIDTEASYPYRGVQGQCMFNPSTIGATAISYVSLPSGNETALTQAIAEVGPISVCIVVTRSFFSYKSGVFYDPNCYPSPNNPGHCVLAVGYGVSDGAEMYIVKNSWGTSWGMQGYIFMSRNRGDNCVIASAATYPIVSASSTAKNSAIGITSTCFELVFAMLMIAFWNLF